MRNATVQQSDLAIREEFSTFVEEHMGLLVHMALPFCKAPDDAEDAVQNALTYCLEHLDQYNPAKGTLKSWVIQAVEWRALNTNRPYRNDLTYIEDMRIRVHDESGEPGKKDGEFPVEISCDPRPQYEIKLSVRTARDQLPEDERAIAVAVFMEGLTIQEYATAEGLSLRTAERRIARAKDKLHNLLAEWRVS